MKRSEKLIKTLSVVGIGLCAACCLLPVGAIIFGMSLTGLAVAFFKWAGLGMAAAALIVLLIMWIKKRKVQACNVDCDCKPVSESKT
jgi:hypothetical protein